MQHWQQENNFHISVSCSIQGSVSCQHLRSLELSLTPRLQSCSHSAGNKSSACPRIFVCLHVSCSIEPLSLPLWLQSLCTLTVRAFDIYLPSLLPWKVASDPPTSCTFQPIGVPKPSALSPPGLPETFSVFSSAWHPGSCLKQQRDIKVLLQAWDNCEDCCIWWYSGGSGPCGKRSRNQVGIRNSGREAASSLCGCELHDLEWYT